MVREGEGDDPAWILSIIILKRARESRLFSSTGMVKIAVILKGRSTCSQRSIMYPDRVNRLILNGANLDAGGVKRSTQIPIEIGYRIAKKSAAKNDAARLKAELLGLMVNDPNVKEAELSGIKAKTLVIAGTKDMIKEEHTKRIARGILDSTLVFVKGDHFIANKNPEEFNQAVLGFMKE